MALSILLGAGFGCSEATKVTQPPPTTTVFAGFDTSIYPGDAKMQAWLKPASPYEWSGYYLPAICHKDASWTGKRATLTAMGWGLAVIYVGLQTFDRVAIVESARATIVEEQGAAAVCTRDLLSKEQGTIDADDAIAKTLAEGFPAGTVIYLDLEHMDTIPASMEAYYRAWIEEIIKDGRYRPGVYAHKANAVAINTGVSASASSLGYTRTIPFWIASTAGFQMDKKPTDVGIPFANVWQGMLDTSQTWNGVSIFIDVDLADSHSPSGI